MFTTESTSRYSQKVLEPIIIYQKDRTRCIFRAEMNDARMAKGETVSGSIIHQRKKQNEEWADVSEFTLAQLKAGEGVKLHFDSEQIKQLYDGLTKLYELGKEGVHSGTNEWVIAEAGKIIEVPEDRKEFINQLIKQNHSEEVWKQLIANNPDLATKLSYSRIQAQRKSSLDEFQKSLTEKKDESYWQNYFENNTWVFGYGLKYVFLKVLQDQPHYGGTDYSGSGAQKGDFLCSTEAPSRFTVLVEIKKPDTPLFKIIGGQIKKYRNGACQLSEELTGAISQLQVNCRTWDAEARTERNFEKLSKEKIYTINPKGILIIGNTNQFDSDIDARQTCESFRTHLNGIDIITYDELFERAKFIVECTHEDQTNDEPQIIEDVPF